MPLPEPIVRYLELLASEERSLAYLEVSADGLVVGSGGDLSSFLIDDPSRGERAADQVPLLEGLLPAPTPSLVLPFVQLEDRRYAEVHVMSAADRDWVLFLDVTAEGMERYRLQQMANEQGLWQSSFSFDGEDPAGQVPLENRGLDPRGERIELTLMQCGVKELTTLSERRSPRVTYRALNRLLRSVARLPEEQGAVLFRLSGDTVLAGFGLGPPVESTAIQAVKTAFRVVQEVERLRRDQEKRDEPGLRVGIAVVTGAVTLGMLGRRRWRRWSVLGTSVRIVDRMEELVQGGEVLVDPPTLQALDEEMASKFQPSPRTLRGDSLATELHSWSVS